MMSASDLKLHINSEQRVLSKENSQQTIFQFAQYLQATQICENAFGQIGVQLKGEEESPCSQWDTEELQAYKKVIEQSSVLRGTSNNTDSNVYISVDACLHSLQSYLSSEEQASLTLHLPTCYVVTLTNQINTQTVLLDTKQVSQDMVQIYQLHLRSKKNTIYPCLIALYTHRLLLLEQVLLIQFHAHTQVLLSLRQHQYSMQDNTSNANSNPHVLSFCLHSLLYSTSIYIQAQPSLTYQGVLQSTALARTVQVQDNIQQDSVLQYFEFLKYTRTGDPSISNIYTCQYDICIASTNLQNSLYYIVPNYTLDSSNAIMSSSEEELYTYITTIYNNIDEKQYIDPNQSGECEFYKDLACDSVVSQLHFAKLDISLSQVTSSEMGGYCIVPLSSGGKTYLPLLKQYSQHPSQVCSTPVTILSKEVLFIILTLPHVQAYLQHILDFHGHQHQYVSSYKVYTQLIRSWQEQGCFEISMHHADATQLLDVATNRALDTRVSSRIPKLIGREEEHPRYTHTNHITSDIRHSFNTQEGCITISNVDAIDAAVYSVSQTLESTTLDILSIYKNKYTFL